MAMFYVKNKDGITVFINGRAVNQNQDHINYKKLIDALKANDEQKVETLLSIADTIKSNVETIGGKANRITIDDSAIYYQDVNGNKEQLHGVLVQKILSDMKKYGEAAIGHLVAFLDNLMKNPRDFVRNELYEFLMSGNIAITEDGHFLAYKKVRRDFMDIYTGTMDNSPGKLVSIDPEIVDNNRTNTCSRGLHFCTFSYLDHYGHCTDNQILIVKINPRYVHAIPNDYQNAKGRCSEYYVVGVLTEYEDVLKDVNFVDSDYKIENVNLHSEKKPSLKAYANSYGFANGNSVYVATLVDGIERDITTENGLFGVITGKKVHKITQMSIETKSVIALLKRAIAKRRP